MKKTMMAVGFAALVCVAVVLGIYPADRTVWCVEMVWAIKHIGCVILPGG